MLQHEDLLPRLPIPALKQTAEAYLKSLRPLLNNEQYEKARAAVDTFTEPSGVGSVLQERLESRRQDPSMKNWLTEWWDEAAYMGYREPHVPYTSYFFSFVDDPKLKSPSKRAAAVSKAVLDFKKLVDEETLSPDYIKEAPQTMDVYRFMFNSCRVPAKPIDYTAKYNPQQYKHILVIHKNKFFKIEHEHQGAQLNLAELEEQFKKVYALANSSDDHGVGILTTQNRDVWTDARGRLILTSKANLDALVDIQSASFVICLDDESPSTLNDRARQYFLGNPSNRWYDKPVNFIICPSGAMGYYGEHSLIDGAPVLRLTDTVLKQTLQADHESEANSVCADIPDPQRITFELDTVNVYDIENAQAHSNLVRSRQNFHAEWYPDYGKQAIKKMKCPPDAYVQMVIQLAYKLYGGQTRPTYESASTRSFRNGRTEACRIVTEESVAFVDSMEDPSSPPEKRRALFKAAIEATVSIQKASNEAQGVDRHLFGLQHLIQEGESTPEIFADAYTLSQTWHVTSSQVSSEFFNGFGFSQAIPHGIGCVYCKRSYHPRQKRAAC